ncbi:MAG TPA: hypothetical protein VF743_05870, partial [Acidimicrobiales bacterium]
MAVTGFPDTALLDRARDGDEAAFTALYVRHHAAVRRLAETYRRGDPDDLVDGTFGQIVAQLRQRSGPTELLRPHLFAIVRRLAAEGLGGGAGGAPAGGVAV